MDALDSEYKEASVTVEGSIISAVGTDLRPSDDALVIDGSGMLLMPGLVNGHFHSPGNFNKGAMVDMPLELFMLYEVPPFACTPTSPRLNYIRTQLGAVEMLKQGVTSVHDDPYYFPKVGTDLIDAVMHGYDDAGIRATVSINMPNVVEDEKYPFLSDLLPADLLAQLKDVPAPSSGELIALYRDFISRWHGARDGRLRAAVSCSAPQRVTPDYLQALSSLSAEFDLPYNIHILETRLQRVLGDQLYGKSLVRHVSDHGVLDERVMVIHAIWVDEYDMDLMAASGCSVAHNPICNLKLGSGIMPYRALASRGINICLGSDEMCSDDAVNMWNVAKQAALIQKITDPDYRNWPQAPEILKCVTVNAAKAMRVREQVGSIEVGMQADLIMLDLDSFAFTPLNDLRRQLIFCETGSSVRWAMVGGRVVIEDGVSTTINEEELKAEVRQLMTEYRSQFREVDQWARRLEPIYREMYQRALACEVTVNRWAT
jgi:5-methylthioadenosine/S-adenosylhomocysteine deaminase